MRNLLFAALALLLITTPAAALIESTPTGGLWSQASTWVGGVVPGQYDDVIVHGLVWPDHMSTCNDLTVYGSMEPPGGGGHVVIHGDLANYGEMSNREGAYGFTSVLHGNLHNEGTLEHSYIDLRGEEPHMLSGTPAGRIELPLLMPEFTPSSLVITTPLLFVNGSIGMGMGTVTLEPGAHLTFEWHGGLGGSFGEGVTYVNGNSITMDQYGAIGGGRIDDAVLSGLVALGAATTFTNGVVVSGTLYNRAHNTIAAEVEGLLRNEGTIQSEGGHFELTIRNDAANMGTWTNHRVVVAGEVNQTIGAGAGIDVPEFVLDSNLDYGPFQWTRDGAVLPGETASTLTLNTVGAADYGVYRCEAAGGLLSRTITIGEFLDATDVAPWSGTMRLAQNHPNPFNPTTKIAFSLDEPADARLTVYDLRGRALETLVDGRFGAGEHQVTWHADGLPSGVYLYRLEVADRVESRSAILLK